MSGRLYSAVVVFWASALSPSGSVRDRGEGIAINVKLKKILAVIALVIVFIFGTVAGWLIKPGNQIQTSLGTAKVTVNPSAKETKKADVAITMQSTGQLTGKANLPRRIVSPGIATPEQPAITSDGTGAGSENFGLAVGESVTIPVSGTITAKYIDAKTKEQIGEDTQTLSGKTAVNVESDQVKVDTRFDYEVTFAVNVPEPAKRLWHAGGISIWSVRDNHVDYDIYIQRDFVLHSTKRTDYLVWVRGELGVADNGRQVIIGVERRW